MIKKVVILLTTLTLGSFLVIHGKDLCEVIKKEIPTGKYHTKTKTVSVKVPDGTKSVADGTISVPDGIESYNCNCNSWTTHSYDIRGHRHTHHHHHCDTCYKTKYKTVTKYKQVPKYKTKSKKQSYTDYSDPIMKTNPAYTTCKDRESKLQKLQSSHHAPSVAEFKSAAHNVIKHAESMTAEAANTIKKHAQHLGDQLKNNLEDQTAKLVSSVKEPGVVAPSVSFKPLPKSEPTVPQVTTPHSYPHVSAPNVDLPKVDLPKIDLPTIPEPKDPTKFSCFYMNNKKVNELTEIKQANFTAKDRQPGESVIQVCEAHMPPSYMINGGFEPCTQGEYCLALKTQKQKKQHNHTIIEIINKNQTSINKGISTFKTSLTTVGDSVKSLTKSIQSVAEDKKKVTNDIERLKESQKNLQSKQDVIEEAKKQLEKDRNELASTKAKAIAKVDTQIKDAKAKLEAQLKKLEATQKALPHTIKSYNNIASLINFLQNTFCGKDAQTKLPQSPCANTLLNRLGELSAQEVTTLQGQVGSTLSLYVDFGAISSTQKESILNAIGPINTALPSMPGAKDKVGTISNVLTALEKETKVLNIDHKETIPAAIKKINGTLKTGFVAVRKKALIHIENALKPNYAKLKTAETKINDSQKLISTAQHRLDVAHNKLVSAQLSINAAIEQLVTSIMKIEALYAHTLPNVLNKLQKGQNGLDMVKRGINLICNNKVRFIPVAVWPHINRPTMPTIPEAYKTVLVPMGPYQKFCSNCRIVNKDMLSCECHRNEHCEPTIYREVRMPRRECYMERFGHQMERPVCHETMIERKERVPNPEYGICNEARHPRGTMLKLDSKNLQEQIIFNGERLETVPYRSATPKRKAPRNTHRPRFGGVSSRMTLGRGRAY